MGSNRSSFTGKIGFVLAAAGSAVGLGNLWRFPYLAAQYGGGIFILVYLILVLTFGYSMLVLEIGIGRKTRKSSISAFKQLDKKFSAFGYLAMIVPMIILPYYCVICSITHNRNDHTRHQKQKDKKHLLFTYREKNMTYETGHC